MEKEIFDKTKFGANMKVIYDKMLCDIWSVDFEERLILIAPENTDVDEQDKGRWVRCENCELELNN